MSDEKDRANWEALMRYVPPADSGPELARIAASLKVGKVLSEYEVSIAVAALERLAESPEARNLVFPNKVGQKWKHDHIDMVVQCLAENELHPKMVAAQASVAHKWSVSPETVKGLVRELRDMASLVLEQGVTNLAKLAPDKSREDHLQHIIAAIDQHRGSPRRPR